MSKAPGADTGTESAWTQRSFLAAAGVLVVIAALALVLIVTGPSEPGASDRAPNKPPARAVTTSTGTTVKCRLGDRDQRVPSTPPAETRWELVGAMLAPTAPRTLGPGTVEDGFRSCFAQSPMGALYAAVNFWALGTAKPSGEIIRLLTADGPERTRALARLRTQRQLPAITHSMQIAGFRVSSYERTTATVGLAMRLANGALASFPTSLRWEDGDWKYVIGPGGRPGVTQLPDLAGYIAWGGA